MKTLGIVGGIGPESTIEYYRFILDGYRARVADGSAPHIIIDSIDVNRAIAMLAAKISRAWRITCPRRSSGWCVPVRKWR